MLQRRFITAALLSALAGGAPAETLEECLGLAALAASETTTVAELRRLCADKLATPQEQRGEKMPERVAAAAGATGAIEKRRALEKYSHDNPFVLTPHRPNYLMPLVYQKDPNEAVFNNADVELQNIEVQFQFSVKLLLAERLFGDNGYLTGAFTNRSFWQAYNSEISSPFRETDYEPEIWLAFDNDWELFGFRNVSNQFIVNHQSNGRTGDLSRSWNRLMLSTIWEKDNFVMSLKPWYRIPEDEKHYPGDPDGDDNPDIERYLGNFEFLATWARNQNVYSVMLRNNLRSMDDNKGAVELTWSYPLSTRIKLYLKYFNGYGESLIDYDESMESFGVGFLVSDWL